MRRAKIMTSETSKELIAWFQPSTADISEYLEDTVLFLHQKNMASIPVEPTSGSTSFSSLN